MQLRDCEEGAGTELHGTERDQSVAEGLLSIACPVCKAKPGQKCYDYTKAFPKKTRRFNWDETVHWGRKNLLVKQVMKALRGY